MSPQAIYCAFFGTAISVCMLVIAHIRCATEGHRYVAGGMNSVAQQMDVVGWHGTDVSLTSGTSSLCFVFTVCLVSLHY